MKLQHLEYFVAIVEAQSFSTASKKLHLSQPSLSITLKKLEQELCLTLINRDKKDMSLTKEGEILYEEAKRILTHFSHVSDEMKRLKDDGPLELTIGIIESSNFWVSTVLKDFKQTYPNVYTRIIEVPALKDVKAALNEFQIHLAITNQYTSKDEFHSIPLYEEKLVALLRLSHPLIDIERLTISDLENEDFIIPEEGFQTREDILDMFRYHNIEPNIQYETGRFETASNLTAEGLGITIVPENYVVNMMSNKIHIKYLHDINLSRTVYLSFLKNRYLSPIVQHFIHLVRTHFKD